MKKQLLWWLILLPCCVQAQEIVFPFQAKGPRTIQFSGNGELIGINEKINTSTVFSYLEAGSGRVLAKTTIAGYEVSQFLPSLSGEYIAFLGHRYDETYIFFYRYIGVKNLQFLNSLSLGGSLMDLDPSLVELESNANNDFFLKVKPVDANPRQKTYCYIEKFAHVGEQYYSEFNLGDFPEYEPDFNSSRMDFLKARFSAYDMTPDEKIIPIYTDIPYNKKYLPKGTYTYEKTSYGILELAMGKGGRDYTHYFPSAIECDQEFADDDTLQLNPCYGYEFVDNMGMMALRYDQKTRRLYGVGEAPLVEKMVWKDLKKMNQSNKTNEIINLFSGNYPDAFWRSPGFNKYIPFYYQPDSGTFHLVGKMTTKLPYLEEVPVKDDLPALYKQLQDKAGHLAKVTDFYFSKTKPVLFTFGQLNEITDRICKVDLYTGQIQYMDMDLPMFNRRVEFTAAHKMIVYGTDFNNEFAYRVIDLDNLLTVYSHSLVNNSPATVAEDVALVGHSNNRHLLVYTNETVIHFNFNGLPFHEVYPGNGSITEDLLKACEETEASCMEGKVPDNNNEEFLFFPKPHQQIIRTKDHKKFTITNYDSPFAGKRGAVPGYDIANPLYDPDYPTTVTDVNDSMPQNGYHNFTYDIKTFEWHDFSDRLYTISNQVVEKWNENTRVSEFVYKNHESFVRCFDVMKDDSLMVTSSQDGKICITNIITNKPLADLYLFDQGKNWIFILPDNYYYGTKDAVKQIAFAFNTKALPIEYFELKYNRPDKVLKSLGCTNKKLTDAFYNAYQKRLKKLKLEEAVLSLDFDIPYLKITNEKMIPLETEEDRLDLNLNMYDLKNPIEKINIYINGVPIPNEYLAKEKNQHHISRTISLALASGINQVEISVTNARGVESPRQKITTTCTKQKPYDLYLVCIGAGQYQQSDYNLKYAEKDAADFMATLQKNHVGFNHIHRLFFTGKDVEKNIIATIKDSLRKANMEDVVYIYYAGHGVLDDRFDYYLGTWNIDFNNPSAKGILYEDLENIMENTASLQKIILLDACHSGEIEKEEIAFVDKKEGTDTSSVTFRDVGKGIKEKDESALNTSRLLKNVFTEMRKGTGSTVISSAGGAEYAIEGDEWKNGLFTYCLLKGLSGQAADLNQDGQIMISELQHYLGQEVKKLSHGKQQPTSRIENTSVDFKIW